VNGPLLCCLLVADRSSTDFNLLTPATTLPPGENGAYFGQAMAPPTGQKSLCHRVISHQ